ncbi:TlpA disulfide reductase family protein [Paraburkholderia largidicola]|jgi:thiol-disulfide isomerase/thioredoxin|uniref:Thiol:disulfide interchange protein n=1 Tax=Paraburkholderia largidicola TaxID=3014751 RepID=A0A7I8BZ91_9BURK|nr:TlpA disulfide reductase family protein [Paraburkholderia sp. PGU16]BCF94062.1 thiol:disulfide interchange protein [Paraburkholderia sp. PGU16]
MNIGPLALPAGPLALFIGIAVALFVSRFAGEKRSEVERALLTALVIGLVVARVAFVLQYLPSYRGNFLPMLDIRDAGFAVIPGIVAGIAVAGIAAIRRSAIRRPLAIAAISGLIAWGIAGEVAERSDQPSHVPAISLSDEAGMPQPLARNNGKPLVVNLWATWCGPCRGEMPVLASEQARHPELDLVFVNQGEDRHTVQTFLADLKLHIDNAYFDPQLALAKSVNVTAYPTTLFYDANGRLLEKHLGRVSEATFDAMLARLYPSLESSRP